MSLDSAFISKLITMPNLLAIREKGITPDMLFDDGRKAFDFIFTFFASYGNMPSVDTVERHVGAEFKDSVPEPIEYYCDQLRDRWLATTLASGVESYVGKMESRDINGALDVLKQLVAKAQEKAPKIKDTGFVDLRTNTNERWQAYQKAKLLGGQIDGLPTPWPALNDETLGIHPGELWFVVARLKTGKTFIELAFADHFFRNKSKVLLVSMEMPISKITQRLDAMHSKLPYGDFKRGKLSTELEGKWHNELAVDWSGDDKTPLWIAGKGMVKSVQDLEIVIEERKPDIVLVDGVYLMKSSARRADSKWERVAGVADDLQDLAQRKLVPIIATTQFNRKVKRDTMDAGAESLGFAYELAQNCDGLIGMFQDGDMKNAKKMYLRLLEHREGNNVDLEINWDFDKMDFSQIQVVDLSALGKDDEGEDAVKY